MDVEWKGLQEKGNGIMAIWDITGIDLTSENWEHLEIQHQQLGSF
jgi:hypothetical protein